MPILLAVALLVLFVVVRRLLEPACPCCSAKRWASQTSGILRCTACGWSNMTPTAAPAEPAPEPAPRAQYEMVLG